jgi:hypothetical protein
VHAIDAWQAPPEMAAELPSLLLGDDGTVVQLIDAEHWRGRAQVNARTAYNLAEQDRCRPATRRALLCGEYLGSLGIALVQAILVG